MSEDILAAQRARFLARLEEVKALLNAKEELQRLLALAEDQWAGTVSESMGVLGSIDLMRDNLLGKRKEEERRYADAATEFPTWMVQEIRKALEEL